MHCSFLETLMLELILTAITETRKSKVSQPFLSLTNGGKIIDMQLNQWLWFKCLTEKRHVNHSVPMYQWSHGLTTTQCKK